jgi:hypothetical protein
MTSSSAYISKVPNVSDPTLEQGAALAANLLSL